MAFCLKKIKEKLLSSILKYSRNSYCVQVISCGAFNCPRTGHNFLLLILKSYIYLLTSGYILISFLPSWALFLGLLSLQIKQKKPTKLKNIFEMLAFKWSNMINYYRDEGKGLEAEGWLCPPMAVPFVNVFALSPCWTAYLEMHDSMLHHSFRDTAQLYSRLGLKMDHVIM